MGGVLNCSEALKKAWGNDNDFTTRSMDAYIAKLGKYLDHDHRIKVVSIHGNGFELKLKK